MITEVLIVYFLSNIITLDHKFIKTKYTKSFFFLIYFLFQTAVKENARRKEIEEKQRKAKEAKERAEKEKEERKKKKANLDIEGINSLFIYFVIS